MTNEKILEKRWSSIDKYLKKYVKDYNKLNTKTKDKLQDIFNSFDIEYSDINKPISKAKKNRLDRFINKLKEKGLLTGYFGYQARLILNKKNVTYAEMLEIMIQGTYIEENKELDEINNDLFYKVCETSYNQGLEEINGKTSNLFNSSKLALLLSIPILGMRISQYMESLALANANELYKQTLINKQLGKALNVDNRTYRDLFNKQRNRIVDINGDKLSGGIVNITNNLSNSAFLEAGKDNNVKQCRFIAELDKRTTDMCKSMDNMLFNMDDWNKFYRYSAVDGRDVLYTVKGLEPGINLPPITNHFHWCRSTITYLIDLNIENLRGYIYHTDDKYISNEQKMETRDIINKTLSILDENIIKACDGVHVKSYDSDNVSFFRPSENTIYLGRNTNEYTLIHELGHKYYHSKNLEKNKEYISLLKNKFGKLKKEDFRFSIENNCYFLKDYSNFVSEYQTRIYNKYSFKVFSNKVNIFQAREYFSEGLRCYYEEPDFLFSKDKNLYYFIERIIKNDK